MNLDRKDIKLSTLNTQYYYTGNNVTCELCVTTTAPEAFKELIGGVFMVVKATAKCHKDDTYNRKCGEKIALAKAEAKAYRLVSNEINRKWSRITDMIETLYPYKEAFTEKAEKSINHNAEYIKGLPAKFAE